jgi:hypothetical protein
MLRKFWKVVTATGAVLALSAAVGLSAPSSASAAPVNCRAGLVNAHTARGTCDAGMGWQEFRLTVQCWWWGANTVYGFPGAYETIYTYDTCPSWSHITSIYIGPA